MLLVLGVGLALSLQKVTESVYVCGANLVCFAIGVGAGQWAKAKARKEGGFTSMAHPRR